MIWALVAILAVAVTYFVSGYVEKRLLFHPVRKLQTKPQQIGLAFEEITLQATDGVNVHAWFIPHPQPLATVLFSHGNSGNISTRLPKLRVFHELRLSVLLYDYRGYGQSGGSPTEPGLYLDGQTAYDWLANQKKISGDRLIAYGESLGGAVSVHLAARNKLGAIILEGTFAKYEEVARHHYPLLWRFRRMKFETVRLVESLTLPTLVLHSSEDEIIPVDQGRQLFAAAKQPKAFVELHGNHNGSFYDSGAVYEDGLRNFLAAHFHG